MLGSRLAVRSLPTRGFSATFRQILLCQSGQRPHPNQPKTRKITIQDLISKQELPATAQNLIVTTPRTSRIYFKPKIHKPNNPGRPAVSACSCPTELISSYLAKIMVPFVKSLPSHVKDTNHALKIFRDFTFSGENKFIFTMDHHYFFINCHTEQRRTSTTQIFLRPALQQKSSETLLRLAEQVLTLNCFSFSNNHYQ